MPLQSSSRRRLVSVSCLKLWWTRKNSLIIKRVRECRENGIRYILNGCVFCPRRTWSGPRAAGRQCWALNLPAGGAALPTVTAAALGGKDALREIRRFRPWQEPSPLLEWECCWGLCLEQFALKEKSLVSEQGMSPNQQCFPPPPF